MAGNLVIVESPAKAGTIQKFLGDGYTVKSSFGHVRDLPDKDEAFLREKLITMYANPVLNQEKAMQS